MRSSSSLGIFGIARRGIAVVGIAAMTAMPVAPVAQAQSPPTVTTTVRLAASTVPPGGLITSFLGNQVIYCSIICPLVVQTAVTATATTLMTPITFLTALPSGDLLRAIGIAAASVTGSTNAAAQAAILADGTLVAPRALNALQVGVVGLLNVIPAAADGLPGIVAAIRTAREDTFRALNAPIVPNPTPTVMPRGVLQVAVVEAINVGAAIIFPAFNHVLSAVFETPNAIAQELAAGGNLVRAATAGVDAAATRLNAAGTVVADAVVTAVRNVHTAIEQSRPARQATDDSARSTDRDEGEEGSALPDTSEGAVERFSERPRRAASNRSDSSDDQSEREAANAREEADAEVEREEADAEVGHEVADATRAPDTESSRDDGEG